jgi:hypothetical protein
MGSVGILNPLKIFGFPFLTFYPKRPEPAYSQDFSAHESRGADSGLLLAECNEGHKNPSHDSNLKV